MTNLKQRGVHITQKKKNGITRIEVETTAMDDLIYDMPTLDTECKNETKETLTKIFKP